MRRSASGTIVRIFGTRIVRPLRPSRSCQKSAGPGLRIFTAAMAARVQLLYGDAIYCFFDHTWQIVETAHRQALISDGLCRDLRRVIRSSSTSLPRVMEDAKL